MHVSQLEDTRRAAADQRKAQSSRPHPFGCTLSHRPLAVWPLDLNSQISNLNSFFSAALRRFVIQTILVILYRKYTIIALETADKIE